MTPMPPAKSMYSRPSTVVMMEFLAWSAKMGLYCVTPRGTFWFRSAEKLLGVPHLAHYLVTSFTISSKAFT